MTNAQAMAKAIEACAAHDCDRDRKLDAVDDRVVWVEE